MSRRPLRKIAGSLDINRWLVLPEQLPDPWDAAALFGRQAPLEVEVGSGKGLFLAQAASDRPEHNFLGIEVAERYATYCAGKFARQGLANARMVHGDAQRVFAHSLPAASVAAVHVYFPDPWWKARHRKRRVMNPQFLREMERVLEPGGALHFWTDVEEYFLSGVETVRNSTELVGPLDVEERPAEHDLDFHTHFERRTRLHGEAVFRSEFRKAK